MQALIGPSYPQFLQIIRVFLVLLTIFTSLVAFLQPIMPTIRLGNHTKLVTVVTPSFLSLVHVIASQDRLPA